MGESGRANQKRRTRKDLLEAASRLMREGRRPSLDEVAEAALVSRATAYRYFPGIEALLLEASLDVVTPQPGELFGPQAPRDPLERLLAVEAALDGMIAANELPLRMMLAQSLERSVAQGAGEAPLRQNRRGPLIEAALEPLEGRLDGARLQRLRQALTLLLGIEATVVFADVLQLDAEEARATRRWAMEALLRAALEAEGLSRLAQAQG
ncbi:MAG TPA: helix-turn-helix domain-containing protein [Phenylobacterium sp.]|nr:helix-turn-helix domain-containing protein [Phenylobacterium sp.]